MGPFRVDDFLSGGASAVAAGDHERVTLLRGEAESPGDEGSAEALDAFLCECTPTVAVVRADVLPLAGSLRGRSAAAQV